MIQEKQSILSFLNRHLHSDLNTAKTMSVNNLGMHTENRNGKLNSNYGEFEELTLRYKQIYFICRREILFYREIA